MAANFIDTDKANEIIRTAIRGIQMIREGKFNVDNALNSMGALKDGDGTLAAHFAMLATECSIQAGGYANANTAAKKLYDELNSVNGNSVAGANAATQLCGYLGV